MLDKKAIKIMYIVLLITCTTVLAISFIIDTNLILKIANVIVIVTSIKNIQEINKEVKGTH
ncbi:hypothetical protein ACMGE9_12295 [Macrococcus sp. EM39E]|uniref:hypothetical protein n=1 Tax=Macrococcus animalis TaxID=3395467 RepID=UPI0039BE9ADF